MDTPPRHATAEEQHDVGTVPAEDLIWYFAYASFMNASVFNEQIGLPEPVEAVTVTAENACLSFDYCGIPFVEPAYASLIIKGYNDQGAYSSAYNARRYGDLAYKRYMHDRCWPGIPFTPPGELPPDVEGIAYHITSEQMAFLAEASGFRIAQVICHTLEGKIMPAYCLVAKERFRSSRLMPTVTSFAAVYRGALSHNLSLRYVQYLAQLRPYNLAGASRKIRSVRSLFVGLVLIPQFTFLYLPLAACQRLLGPFAYRPLERAKLAVSDFIRSTSLIAERLLVRPLLGRIAFAIDLD